VTYTEWCGFGYVTLVDLKLHIFLKGSVTYRVTCITVNDFEFEKLCVYKLINLISFDSYDQKIWEEILYSNNYSTQ